MNFTTKKLPRGQLEIRAELSAQDFEPYLKAAVEELSKTTKIAGFRPGKATFEAVKFSLGEKKIYEAALEPAIRNTFVEIVKKEKLETVGSPQIEVEKFASPQNILVIPKKDSPASDLKLVLIFKATINLLPEIKIGDYKNLKVEKRPIKISQDSVDDNLLNLQKIKHSEILVNRSAQKGDKVEIDLETFLNNVPVENGQQKKLPIVLGEGAYLPGFEKNLIGQKAGAEREFELNLPPNYYQKNLAGKLVKFKVKVLGIYEIKLPEANDEFAKNLGFADLEQLKKQVEENLFKDAEAKEEQRLEEEILNKIVQDCSFSDICDLLINSEAQKMVSEFETVIVQKGLNFDDYLKSLGQSRENLLLDFTPEAVKRVKVAIAVRKISQSENIGVTDSEIEKEIKKISEVYSENPKILENIRQPEYRQYLQNILISRKTIEFLKKVNIE